MAVLSASELRQQMTDLLDQHDQYNEVVLDSDSTPEMQTEAEKSAKELFEQAEALRPKVELAEKMESRRKARSEPARDLQVKDKKEVEAVLPRHVRRYECKNFKGQRELQIGDYKHSMTAEERAYTFGQYLLATASMTQPGKYGHLNVHRERFEKRYGKLYRTTQSVPHMAAAEGDNAGIWVPEQYGLDIVKLVLRYGMARQLFAMKQMVRDKRTDPKRGSNVTASWNGEAVEGTDATPTDDSLIELVAKKLMSIVIYSSELNEDSIIEFADDMLMRMAEGFAVAEDTAGFNGTGISTNGNIKGLRTKLQDVDDAGTDSAGLVTGAGNLWTELTRANFNSVIGTLPDYADNGPEDSPNTVWVCHRAFYWNVMAEIAQAAGGTPASEMQDGVRRPVFMGWPVRFSNSYPSTAANSSVVCTFGDHARAANFGDRRAYSVDFSTEATIGTVNLFSSDQIAAKATERIDINVHSVGDASNAGPVVGLQTAAS